MQLSGMHEVGSARMKIHEHDSYSKTCFVGDMYIENGVQKDWLLLLQFLIVSATRRRIEIKMLLCLSVLAQKRLI